MTNLHVNRRRFKANTVITHFNREHFMLTRCLYPDHMSLSMTSDIGQSFGNHAYHLFAKRCWCGREQGKFSLTGDFSRCGKAIDLLLHDFDEIIWTNGCSSHVPNGAT